jgi:hypothetical protein
MDLILVDRCCSSALFVALARRLSVYLLQQVFLVGAGTALLDVGVGFFY